MLPECVHCGSTLAVARVIKVTEDGYEYACQPCAFKLGLRPAPAGAS